MKKLMGLLVLVGCMFSNTLAINDILKKILVKDPKKEIKKITKEQVVKAVERASKLLRPMK